MKTALLIGATLGVVGAAIVSTSAQTQSASPAATAPPARTAASPVPSRDCNGESSDAPRNDQADPIAPSQETGTARS